MHQRHKTPPLSLRFQNGTRQLSQYLNQLVILAQCCLEDDPFRRIIASDVIKYRLMIDLLIYVGYVPTEFDPRKTGITFYRKVG